MSQVNTEGKTQVPLKSLDTGSVRLPVACLLQLPLVCVQACRILFPANNWRQARGRKLRIDETLHG